jgi:hypothetical protein
LLTVNSRFFSQSASSTIEYFASSILMKPHCLRSFQYATRWWAIHKTHPRWVAGGPGFTHNKSGRHIFATVSSRKNRDNPRCLLSIPSLHKVQLISRGVARTTIRLKMKFHQRQIGVHASKLAFSKIIFLPSATKLA